jgi:hypothetical protein
LSGRWGRFQHSKETVTDAGCTVLILKKRIFSEKNKAFGMKPGGCQNVFQSKTAAKVKFPDKRKDFEFFFHVQRSK